MDTPPVAYGFAKARLFFLTAAALILLAPTMFGAIHFALAGSWSDVAVLSVASIPLFVIEVWAWRRLLGDRPALVLAADMLIDDSSLFPARRINRTDIAEVHVRSAGWWPSVTLDLHDSARRKRLTTPTILPFLLGVSADYLAEQIRYWQRKGTRF